MSEDEIRFTIKKSIVTAHEIQQRYYASLKAIEPPYLPERYEPCKCNTCEEMRANDTTAVE